MDNLIWYIEYDTFISERYKYDNYWMSSSIIAGNECITRTMKYRLMPLMKLIIPNELKNRTISEAKLYLYVKAYKNIHQNEGIYIQLGRVEETFKTTLVSWNDKLNITKLSQFSHIDTNDISTYISIDITDLLNEWIVGKAPNYGLALIPDRSCSILQFSSSKGIFNRPYIEYSLE